MDNIILVNKPSGISSNQLLQKIKRLFNAQKAGHAGTLDPLATGMLPICFNKATRINQFLLNQNKCYQATIQLGLITDSGDINGKVLNSETPPTFDKRHIKTVLKTFVGPAWQTPPQFSALKYQGKPLYYYARKGIKIDKAARPITIYDVKLLEYQDSHFRIEVSCSKGTYIRSLAESIGKKLGCGGCISSLYRHWCGPFEQSPMYTIEDLQDLSDADRLKCCVSMSLALKNLPHCEVIAGYEQDYVLGKKIPRQMIKQETNSLQLSPIVVYSANQRLLGIAELDDNLLHPRKLLITPTDIVIG